MSYLFCNKCSHRNPPESSFCSSCGSVLDSVGDHTLVIPKVDPLQDAPGEQDNIVVDLNEIRQGTAILVMRNGETEGKYFSLGLANTSIGRHDESSIVLDDITVSRRHTEIHNDGVQYLIRDAGSLNGTYVNNERIDVAELLQGDEIQIGKYHLIFLKSIESSK